MSASTSTHSYLHLEVSEDRLQAWVHVQGLERAGAPLPTVGDVLSFLEQGKIALNDEVKKRVERLVAEILQKASSGSEGGLTAAPLRFLVAEGRPPTEGEDGRFEWSPELAKLFAQPGENETVDYFARTAFATVDVGTVVGRVVAARNGEPGADVHGGPWPPRKPWGTAVKLGPGVRLMPGGTGEVVAEACGRVAEERGQVRIYEVVDIAHDVDLTSGSVQSCVDVNVHGSVRSNFRVHTTKSLNVGKAIEAADVNVGGALTVRGGIFGQNAGRIRVGGEVVTHLLSEVDIEAGGNIRFQKEILHSRVHALGSLIGDFGTIIGGTTYAREGVVVGTLGSEAGLATPVAVGVEVEGQRRIRQLERQIKETTKSAEQIRQAINPLMADLKRLAREQRERALELLGKADEADLKATELRATVERLVKQAAPRGVPFVTVNEVAHVGTLFIVDAREARLQKLLHGPVKIELRKVEGATEVVAVNQRTGSITVLPSTLVDLDTPPAGCPA